MFPHLLLQARSEIMIRQRERGKRLDACDREARRPLPSVTEMFMMVMPGRLREKPLACHVLGFASAASGDRIGASSRFIFFSWGNFV